MNIADKISIMLTAKSDIKQAIEDKGVDMTNVPFSSYAQKINEISGSTVLGITQKEITEGGLFSWTIVNDTSASYVGKYAFLNYSNISRVSLPACKSISRGGLKSCTELVTCTIPNCEYIDYTAFEDDTKLKFITLSNVSYIGSYAFDRCSSLVQVALNKCKFVEDYAFNGCHKMSSIGSTPLIEFIGRRAFMECSALTTINIPMCSFIGDDAFASCSSLKTITVGTNLLKTCHLDGSSVFYNCSALTSIYVPASLVNAYKSATNWSSLSNKIIGI